MAEHLQDLMDALDWQDEVDHDDEEAVDTVHTSYVIGGLIYGLALTLDPKTSWFHVLLISPVAVSPGQRAQALELCNDINDGLPFGRFAVRGTRLSYKHGVDFEGFDEPLMLLQSALSVAGSIVRTHHPDFVRLLLGEAGAAAAAEDEAGDIADAADPKHRLN